MLRLSRRQSVAGAPVTRWSAKVAENAMQHWKVEKETPFRKYLQHGFKLSLDWTEGLHEGFSNPKQLYVRVSNESVKDQQHQDRVMINELDIVKVLSALPIIPDLLFVGSMGNASMEKTVVNAFKSGCCTQEGIKFGRSDKSIISIVDGTGRPLRSLGLHAENAKRALHGAFVLCFGVRELLLHGVIPTNLSPDTVLWHPIKRQFVFLGLGQAIYVGSRHEQTPCSVSVYLKAVQEAANDLPMQSLLDLGVALPHGSLPPSFAPEVRSAHAAAMRENRIQTGSCLGRNVAYQLGGLLYFVATGMEFFTTESLVTSSGGSGRAQAAAGASTRAAATPGIAALALDRAPRVVRGLIEGLLHPDPKKRTDVLEATDFLGNLLWQKHRGNGNGHDRPFARVWSFSQGKSQPAKGASTAVSQPMSCPAQFRLPDRNLGARESKLGRGSLLTSCAGAGAGPLACTGKSSTPVARGPSGARAAIDAVAGASATESSTGRCIRRPSSGAGDDVVVSQLHQASRHGGGPGASRMPTEPDEAPIMVRGVSQLSVSTVADDTAGSSTDLIHEASIDAVHRPRSGSLPSASELHALRERTQRRTSGRLPVLSLSTGSENADFDAHVTMQSDIRTRASTLLSQDRGDIHQQPESPGLSTGSPRHRTLHQAATLASTLGDGRSDSSHGPAPQDGVYAGALTDSKYPVGVGIGGAHGHLHALEGKDELPAAGKAVGASEGPKQPTASARSTSGIRASQTGSIATQLKQESWSYLTSASSSCQPTGDSTNAVSDVSRPQDATCAMLTEGWEPIGTTGSAPDSTLDASEAVIAGHQAIKPLSPSRASALESHTPDKRGKLLAERRILKDMLETLEWERVGMTAGSSLAPAHRLEADSQSVGAIATDSPTAEEPQRLTGTNDAGRLPDDNSSLHAGSTSAAGLPTTGAGQATWGDTTWDGLGAPTGDEAELAPSWPRSALRHDHPQAVAIQSILTGATRQSSQHPQDDDSVRHRTDPAPVADSSPVELEEDGLPRLPTLVRADSGFLGAEATGDNPGLLVSAAAWIAPGLGIGIGPRRTNSWSLAGSGSEVGFAATSTVDLHSPVASQTGEVAPTPRADSPGSGLRIRANHCQPQHSTRRQLSPRAELLYAGVLREIRHQKQSKRPEASQTALHGDSGAGPQATHEAAGSPAPQSSPRRSAVGSVAVGTSTSGTSSGSDARSKRKSGSRNGHASQQRDLLDPVDPSRQISTGAAPSGCTSGRNGGQSGPPRRVTSGQSGPLRSVTSRLSPRRAASHMNCRSEPEPEPESRAESGSQGGNHPLTVDAFLGPSHHGLLSPREAPAQSHVPPQSQLPGPELSISVPGQARAFGAAPGPELSISVPGQARALGAAPGAAGQVQSQSGGNDADADAQEWDAIDAGQDDALVVLPGRILAQLLEAPGSESSDIEDSSEAIDDFERE